MLRSIFTAFLSVSIAVVGALPAVANPNASQEGNSIQDHIQLVNTLRDNGVPVFFNTPQCKPLKGSTVKPSGMYLPDYNVMIICQDNGSTDQQLVEMTLNDLDTIRHESHHAIQDCKDGLINSTMVSLFPLQSDNPEEVTLDQFVTAAGLSAEQLETIQSGYQRMGYSDEVINLEYEAWSAGYAISAATISQGVNHYCADPFGDVMGE